MADNDVKIIISAIDKTSGMLDKVTKSTGGLKGAFNQLRQEVPGLNSAITMLTNPVSLAVMGFGALTKISKEAIKETVAYAESVRTFGRVLGVTAEEASTLIQVADDLVISTETLEQAMRFAVKQGVDISIEGIKKLGEEYKTLETPMEKAQFAQQKFGRYAGIEMQKLLEVSTESIDEMAQSAENAGLVLSQEGVDAARKYEIAMDNLSDSVQGAKYQLGQQLLPAVIEVTDGLNDHLVNVNKTFKALDKLNDLYHKGAINLGEYIGFQTDLRVGLTDNSSTMLILDKIQENYNNELQTGSRIITGYTGYTGNYTSAVEKNTEAIGLNLRESRLLGDYVRESMIPNWDDMEEAAQGAADAVGNVAYQITEATKAALGREAIEKLNEVFLAGKIPEEEYSKTMGILITQWLGLPASTAVATTELGKLEAEWDTGTMKLDTYIARLRDIESKAQAMDGMRVKIYVDIFGGQFPGTVIGLDQPTIAPFTTPYGPPAPPNYSSGNEDWMGEETGPGGQHGLDMTVPPGYPRDSYNVRASSGEHVQITPAGQTTNNANVTVNLNVTGGDGMSLYRQFRQALDADLRARRNAGIQYVGQG